jgi:hypothetical protein
MTESEWLTCTDPEVMLAHLGHHADKRRCLLFGCACERRFWEHQPECERKKVEALECLADGLSDADEVYAALQDLGIALHTFELLNDEIDAVCWANAESEGATEYAADLATSAGKDVPEHEVDMEQVWKATYDAERSVQVGLLRDIFGNPFQSQVVDSSWRTSQVVKLAQAIYDRRTYDQMPQLAGALEDAGCRDAGILDHCNQPGPHVRGCWVVVLLLGME